MKKSQRRIVVVAGSGRSGSSVIARSLRVLGVDLGDNLMPARAGVNDKGFWEDQDVYRLNLEIFNALNHDWHSLDPLDVERLSVISRSELKVKAIDVLNRKLRAATCFGVKDPQMTKILPFWQEVFSELKLNVSYVITCRNPKNVVRSLVRYTGFDETKCYLLWYEYVLTSLLYTNGENRIVVDYDGMMSDPATQLQRMADSLGLPFDPAGQEFSCYRNEFLEESLRHTEFIHEDNQSDERSPVEVKSLFAFLCELALDKIDLNSKDAISFIAEEAATQQQPESVLRNVLAELKSVRSELVSHRVALETAVAHLAARTEELVAARQAADREHTQLIQIDAELLGRTEELVTTRQALSDRTALLEKTNSDLEVRTRELVEVRDLFAQRTDIAESLNKELLGRTEELVTTRQALSDRTALLEKTNSDLEVRTRELVEVRDLFAQRMDIAESLNKELLARIDELFAFHHELGERTGLLQSSQLDLLSRTRDSAGSREALIERTELLNRVSDQLQNHIETVTQTSAALVERTEMLERTNSVLEAVIQELEDSRRLLVERTQCLQKISDELVSRKQELVELHRSFENSTACLEAANVQLLEHARLLEQKNFLLVERSEMLDHASGGLAACAFELSEARQALDDKVRLLELANSEVARLSEGLLRRIWYRLRGG